MVFQPLLQEEAPVLAILFPTKEYHVCVHLTNLTGNLCSYGVAEVCVQAFNLTAPGVSVVLSYELSFPPVFD